MTERTVYAPLKTGQRFHRLIYTGRDEIRPYQGPRKLHRFRYSEFRCDCGNTIWAFRSAVERGKIVSCGCYSREQASKRAMKHGHCAPSLGNQTNSPTYKSWQQMNQRCHNPNHKFYPDYGGRGITVCKRWRASFEAFLEDMGERPEGLELDRIDNNRGYKPSNCKWSTRTQQLQNTRRTTWITIYGEKRSVHEWATLFGVHAELIVKRLKAGWPPDEAITVPSGQSRN